MWELDSRTHILTAVSSFLWLGFTLEYFNYMTTFSIRVRGKCAVSRAVSFVLQLPWRRHTLVHWCHPPVNNDFRETGIPRKGTGAVSEDGQQVGGVLTWEGFDERKQNVLGLHHEHLFHLIPTENTCGASDIYVFECCQMVGSVFICIPVLPLPLLTKRLVLQ